MLNFAEQWSVRLSGEKTVASISFLLKVIFWVVDGDYFYIYHNRANGIKIIYNDYLQ